MYKEEILKAYRDPEAYDTRFEIDKVSDYVREITFERRLKLLEKFSNKGETLEIGCGTCIWLKHIGGVGIDISKNMIKKCKERGIKNIIVGDAENMPFKEGSFDFIYCIGLFPYVDIEKVSKEIRRILKMGGVLLVTFPNKFGIYHMQISLKNKLLRKKDIRNLLSIFYVKKVLSKNGFKIETYRSDGFVFYIPKGNNVYPKVKVLWRKLEDINRFFDRFFPIGHGVTLIAKKVKPE